MSSGPHHLPADTADDVRLMRALDALLAGREPDVALSDAERAELDADVALMREVDALENPAPAPAVRDAVMQAARGEVSARQHEKRAGGWLDWLFQPGPMMALATAAAILLAVAVGGPGGVSNDQTAMRAEAPATSTPAATAEPTETAVALRDDEARDEEGTRAPPSADEPPGSVNKAVGSEGVGADALSGGPPIEARPASVDPEGTSLEAFLDGEPAKAAEVAQVAKAAKADRADRAATKKPAAPKRVRRASKKALALADEDVTRPASKGDLYEQRSEAALPTRLAEAAPSDGDAAQKEAAEEERQDTVVAQRGKAAEELAPPQKNATRRQARTASSDDALLDLNVAQTTAGDSARGGLGSARSRVGSTGQATAQRSASSYGGVVRDSSNRAPASRPPSAASKASAASAPSAAKDSKRGLKDLRRELAEIKDGPRRRTLLSRYLAEAKRSGDEAEVSWAEKQLAALKVEAEAAKKTASRRGKSAQSKRKTAKRKGKAPKAPEDASAKPSK